jgi:hypothetical protein
MSTHDPAMLITIHILIIIIIVCTLFRVTCHGHSNAVIKSYLLSPRRLFHRRGLLPHWRWHD